MFSSIWHTLFMDPVYNGLVFLIDIVPGGDVGVAIILLTIVVKFILLPLSMKSARTQLIMKELEPKQNELKEKYKDDREGLARAMFALYKEAGINPLSGIGLLLIQLPIIIALYISVYSGAGVRLPAINVDLLYSFIPTPEMVSMLFLGLVNIAAKSWPLALIAGATQYFHAQISMPVLTPRAENATPSFKDDFARSMQMQVKYVMPVLIFFIAYTVNAAIALYFVVSNVLSIVQDLYVKRRLAQVSK